MSVPQSIWLYWNGATRAAGACRQGGTHGGGRPDFAQGGGPDGSRAEAALEAIARSLAAARAAAE